MPYSDNLYSADDDASDNESFSNELSPTDGFFNPSPMASTAMVPDPSLDRKDAADEDKVLIPRSETRMESGGASRSTTSPSLRQLFPSQTYASSQSNNRPTPSSSSSTPSPPVSHRRTDSNIFSEPSHSTQGPPPAYTPSSPTTSSHSTHNRSYSTFDPNRLEQGLPSSAEPQSMGRPADDPDERTPLSNNHIRKPSRRRFIIKKLLFVALVVAVSMAIMTPLFKLGRSISKDNPKAPGGKLPEETKPPDLGLPDDPSTSYCTSATIHAGEDFFDFALDKSLRVLQETHEGDRGSNSQTVRTSGEIRLRKLPKNSRYGSRGLISIDVHVSDYGLQIRKTWDDDLRTMRISVPKTSSFNSQGGNNCISLEITVWLPEGTSLSALSIASTLLTVRVFDDIKFKVTGKSEFISLSDDVIFPENGIHNSVPPLTYPLDARHITVETISGNIKGIYPLYDYLKLSSQSGEINVGVYPQAVLPSAPEPADLEVSTSSGKVQVNLPVRLPRYNPPARDYETRVASASGDISGSYFLGSTGSFKSTSGEINAKILPVIPYSPSTDPDDAPKAQLETWSVSGDHKLEILDPVFISLLPSNKPDQHHSPESYIPIGDDDPYQNIVPPNLDQDVVMEDRSLGARKRHAAKRWRTLTATHQTTSAEISVHYPEAWEGTVSGKTMSGDIDVKGKDLKIISSKKGWAFKELLAGKGVSKKGEGSSVTMSGISSDLKFIVGEEEEMDGQNLD